MVTTKRNEVSERRRALCFTREPDHVDVHGDIVRDDGLLFELEFLERVGLEDLFHL